MFLVAERLGCADRVAGTHEPVVRAFVISIAVQLKCQSQRLVQQRHVFPGERTDEVCEEGFGDAYEFVAVDAAGMLHPLVRADWHLRGQPLVRRVDRGANDG